MGAVRDFFVAFYKRFIANLKNPDSMRRYVLYHDLVGCSSMAWPSLVSNAFTIPLSGDYVMQQFRFYYNGYDDWWTFFKTGEFVLWDSSTYLDQATSAAIRSITT
jgi:hypothetical protein